MLPVSYAGMLRSVTTYGCLYFGGLYFLLKTWMRDSLWAAVAVVFALTMQLFHGLGVGEVMWRYPSSTVVRSAVDVWLLFALLLHLRTINARWLVVAGALAGLALLLELDTGVYLAAAFTGYWVWCLGAKDHGLRPRARVLAESAGAAAFVFLVGIAIASRGSLFGGAFWKGLIEPLLSLPGGFTMIPIAANPDWVWLLFATILGTYLVAFGLMLAKCVRREGEPGGATEWDMRIVRKVNTDANDVLKTKDLQDFLKAQGADVLLTTPEEFHKLLVADVAKWSKVVRASGARID